MKQAQSGTTRHDRLHRWRAGGWVAPRPWWPGYATYDPEVDSVASPAHAPPWTAAIMALFGAAWFVVTLPFRLVFWTIAWLGRLTGALLGFVLMVLGMFFMAGPLFLIGVPFFVIGLVLTLRCLE